MLEFISIKEIESGTKRLKSKRYSVKSGHISVIQRFFFRIPEICSRKFVRIFFLHQIHDP